MIMSNIFEPKLAQILQKDGQMGFPDLSKLEGYTGGINPNGMYTTKNGEPYVFLKDFELLVGTTDGSIGTTLFVYKKGDVVYPYPSVNPNEKVAINPAFTKAINEGVLVKKNNEDLAKEQISKAIQVNQVQKGFTEKVFGTQANGFGIGERPIRLGAYIVIGAFIGKYVAKKMNKSSTLGIVIGGFTPLLAYKLSIEHDKKNAEKLPQLQLKKVAV